MKREVSSKKWGHGFLSLSVMSEKEKRQCFYSFLRTNDANLQKQDKNLWLCPLKCLQLFLLLSVIPYPVFSTWLCIISSLSFLLSLMIWSITVGIVQLCVFEFISRCLCLISVKEHLDGHAGKGQTERVNGEDTEVCQSNDFFFFSPVNLGLKRWLNVLEQMLGRPKSWLKVSCSLYLGGGGTSCLLRLWTDSQIKVHVRMERLGSYNRLGILPVPLSLCCHPPGWTFSIA